MLGFVNLEVIIRRGPQSAPDLLRMEQCLGWLEEESFRVMNGS
jgi:hypothetical protein